MIYSSIRPLARALLLPPLFADSLLGRLPFPRLLGLPRHPTAPKWLTVNYAGELQNSELRREISVASSPVYTVT